MANKKKRAAWGSRKRAAEAADAGAAETATTDNVVTNGDGAVEAAPLPSLGAAIENVKNWLLPFAPEERKQILRAVGVFLK